MYTNCKGLINQVSLMRLSSYLKTKSLPDKSWEKRFKITFTISLIRVYPPLLAKRRTYSLSRKIQESLREIKTLRLDKLMNLVWGHLNLLWVQLRIESLPGKRRENKLKIKSISSKKSIILHSPRKLKTC